MIRFNLDVETRSMLDLRVVGHHRYFEHESTSVLCACYAFDGGAVHTWTPGEDPPDLPPVFWLSAFNAAFEASAWWNVLTPRHGWPQLDAGSIYCTQAKAAAMSLPASLDGVAKALQLPVTKDDAGRRIMLKWCRPRSINEDGSPVWWGDGDTAKEREEFAQLVDYCRQDVVVERDIGAAVRELPDSEVRVYRMSERINRRGVRVDLELVNAGIKVATARRAQIKSLVKEITDGISPHQVAKLGDWLRDRGYVPESLAKDDIAAALDAKTLDPEVEEVLRLRQAVAMTSTKKLERLRDATGKYDRLRGMYSYHRAGTGRFQSMLVNLANLARPTVDPDLAVELVSKGDLDEFGEIEPMEAVSSIVRACLVGQPGHPLVVGDWSQIEARLTAYLSGQENVVEVFAGGRDVYLDTASKIFHIPRDLVTNRERTIGKVATLALGFGGGVGAFQSMARNYGVDFTDDKAETIKKSWRLANAVTCRFWYDLNDAAIGATRNHGTVVPVREVAFVHKNGHLWLRLPSGRLLCYPYAQVKKVTTPWDSKRIAVVSEGVDPYTRKWTQVTLTPGRITENVVQAAARDILVQAMIALERESQRVVMHVYDEVIVEGGSEMVLKEIMTSDVPWAPGLPLAAEIYTSERYRK